MQFRDIFNINHYAQCRDLFQPVMKRDELNYFGYCRLYPDKRFINLATDPAWSNHYYNVSNLPPAFLNDQTALTNSISLPSMDTDNQFGWPEGTVREVRERFGVENPIFITKRFRDYIEVYGMSFNKSNIHEFYVNQLDSIEQIIFYFKDQASELINELVKSPVDHYANKSLDQLTMHNSSNLVGQDLPIKQYEFILEGQPYYITPRQYEILTYLNQGATSKSIALQLHCSAKTVEYHIDRIKQCFGVNYKSQLIEVFQNNHLPNN